MFKKLFSRKPKAPESNLPSREGGFPLRPHNHDSATDFLLNQYDTFGLISFLQRRGDDEGQLVDLDLFHVIMMENGYGERYCNVLCNGILVRDSSELQRTEEWKKHIRPWLDNNTDWFPRQSALMDARLALDIVEFYKTKPK